MTKDEGILLKYMQLLNHLNDDLKLRLVTRLLQSVTKEKNGQDLTKEEQPLKMVDLDTQNLSFEEKLKLTKPMVQDITLEEIKRQQNYKPIDVEKFDKLVAELNIQEPIEDLLKMLTP
jgi:hypothetical protein